MGESRELKLVKNTIIYTISSFGSKVLTFLIVPLYTFYLTTAEFGTYDTIISVLNLLAPMCVLAIHEGMLRWLLKSEDKHGDIVGTGLTLLTVFIFIADIVVWSVCTLIKWKYKELFILLLTFSAFQNSFQFMARGEKKNKVFAVSGIIYTLIMLSLNVILVVMFRMGVKGMLWSMAIAYLVDTIYLVLMLRDCIDIKEIRFNKKLALSMLAYSIMLVPNNISWWVMNTSDRLMLTAMSGAAVTGIYSLANKFPSIVTILHTLFYQAWQEQAVLEYDSDTRDTYYTKVFNSYMKVACCIVAILIPLSKVVIVLFMDESYLSSYKYVGILYLGAIFSSFSSFYGTGYISAKDTKNAMKTTIVGAIVNFLINLILIPFIGIWAACISTVCGNIIVWIIRIKDTKKYFNISIKWKTFCIIMLVNIAFTVIICFINLYETILMLMIAIIISVAINKEILENMIRIIKKKILGEN